MIPITFILAVLTATFLIYCTVKFMIDTIKAKKGTINPKNVKSFIEPIKQVYYKLLPDGSIIEGIKTIGYKTVYFFKKSRKQLKNERKQREKWEKESGVKSPKADRDFYGVMDRDFSDYQKGVQASRENYMRRRSR